MPAGSVSDTSLESSPVISSRVAPRASEEGHGRKEAEEQRLSRVAKIDLLRPCWSCPRTAMSQSRGQDERRTNELTGLLACSS